MELNDSDQQNIVLAKKFASFTNFQDLLIKANETRKRKIICQLFPSELLGKLG